MTISTPRAQVESRAVELVRRLGNDLAELSVLIPLAGQHGLVLPAGLRRAALALAADAVEFPTYADLGCLRAAHPERGEAA